jgi:HrpA-like RNA helicase
MVSQLYFASVTIPDVVCVLDTGRVKEIRQSKRFLTSQLATDWCSKASAKQRAGRAGRVQAGICLKLYSSDTANRVMQPASLPELQVEIIIVCFAYH